MKNHESKKQEQDRKCSGSQTGSQHSTQCGTERGNSYGQQCESERGDKHSTQCGTERGNSYGQQCESERGDKHGTQCETERGNSYGQQCESERGDKHSTQCETERGNSYGQQCESERGDKHSTHRESEHESENGSEHKSQSSTKKAAAESGNNSYMTREYHSMSFMVSRMENGQPTQISIHRETGKPTTVYVSSGEKSWHLESTQLDKLPEDLREEVRSLLWEPEELSTLESSGITRVLRSEMENEIERAEDVMEDILLGR